ncbi:CoB--CoM heterodisulfide reductase iron-sulfur subunit A family protein, partial [Acidithiobacillus ferrooxidans]|nr:CoB--CoM heterodisulfide reductase iron-sulfur subunit A family protein [Acidithiobacillus ferrooxidans]
MSAQDTVLVVGAGPAGLSAAATIASMGKKAVIVEKEDILGGAPIISGYAKLVPSGEWAKDAIGRMVSRVEGDGNISIHKSAKVTQVEGEAGNFTATLSNGDKVEAGAIILGTGFTHFDSINKPEWGFGTYEDVLTTTQMEQMVTAGQIRCPSDGRVPERVAILLCVGSRDRQIGREWCSKICCTVSTNLAMEIKEISPSTDVFIYYM